VTETPDVPQTPAERTAAAIGPWATAAEAYDLLTVTVPAEHWIEALTAARDVLGLAFLDWLSAVDELAEGFAVCAHLAAVGEPGSVRRLLLRTRVPRDKAVLPTAVGVYVGAAWHERETREMFGIEFPGHPYPATLLLPDGFEGHPLRKDFVLAARVAKDWPGAKEPGESDHGGGPARRKMLPPGVPDPNEWGPLKGTLPPVAERPARATRAGRYRGWETEFIAGLPLGVGGRSGRNALSSVLTGRRSGGLALHPAAQTGGTHVRPHPADVVQALLLAALGALGPPARGQFPIGLPDRVLLLVVEHDAVDALGVVGHRRLSSVGGGAAVDTGARASVPSGDGRP